MLFPLTTSGKDAPPSISSRTSGISSFAPTDRTDGASGCDPEEAVDQGKIRRTVAAADAYVRYMNSDLPVRFDLVFVTLTKEHTEVEHIEDAFMAPCR